MGRAVLTRIARPLVAVAATLALAGIGVGVDATAASASSTFTTPMWGMTCTTWTSGGFGNYTANATCSGYGIWQVEASCSFGTNPTSLIMSNDIFTTQTASAPPCYWGVNEIKIREYVRTP